MVLLRKVAQVVMVPTTVVSRNGVRDAGKELPRVEPGFSMLSWDEPAQSTTGNLPSMHKFRGYLGDNHCSDVFSTVERPKRLQGTSFKRRFSPELGTYQCCRVAII